MNTTAEMVDLLKTGMFLVTFTKKNGELRTMRGTLPSDAFALNEESVPFLDESGIWKSFRLDSVIEVTPAS